MPTDAAGRGAGKSDYDFPVVITAMPINAGQRRLALGVVMLLFVIGIAIAPFAAAPGPRLDAFIPVLQTVVCLVDLMTAALLFSQYFIRPLRATLAIAAGYVCTGLLAFIQTLAFPGAYSRTGLIGDGLNSASWLFVFWHTVFPLAVLTYALFKDRDNVSSSLGKSPLAAIVATIAGVLAAAALLTWIALKPPAFLPPMYVDIARQTRWANAANVYLLLMNSTALAVLFFRRRTILDLWLAVTLFAWWPNFMAAIFFTAVRFSLGWYISRCFSVIASSTLLLVLLSETTVLYARLANSILLLRRERTDRLASVEAATAALAHEIRQPLAGITSFGAAGLRWLSRIPAEAEKAKSCFRAILDAAQRAEEIIASVRDLVKKTPSHRTLVQLSDLSRLVMQLAQHDLLSNGITVASDYQEDLPLVHADPIQLQQVILNLVKNAIDAMSDRPLGERRLRVAAGSDGHSGVSFYIRDAGPGIAADDHDRIFSPFFTTKSSGMGLGLSICRTIIEDHGGTLRLTKTGPGGATFEISLPIAPPQQQAGDRQTPNAKDRDAAPLVME